MSRPPPDLFRAGCQETQQASPGALPAPRAPPGQAPPSPSLLETAVTSRGPRRQRTAERDPPEPASRALPRPDAGLPRGEGLRTHLVGNFKSPQQGHDLLLEVLLLRDKQAGIRALGAASRRTQWGRHRAAPRGRPQPVGGTAQTRGNTYELEHGCRHFNNSKRFHKPLKPQLWSD